MLLAILLPLCLLFILSGLGDFSSTQRHQTPPLTKRQKARAEARAKKMRNPYYWS